MFCIIIQIRWKFYCAVIQVPVKWLLWNFAHDISAVLSWHVKTFVAIWYPTMHLLWNHFPSNSNYNQIIICEMVPRSEGVWCHNARRCVQSGNPIPRTLDHWIGRTVCTSPSAFWQQNLTDRSVLFTIVIWHFKNHPVNVSILHLEGEYGALNESSFACRFHFHVKWCPFTTVILASQCPSSRDALPPQNKC